MAIKSLLEKVRKQGMSFQLSANKRCLQHLMLHPYITASKQAAKTDKLSVVSIQVLCTVEEGVANACI